MDHQTIDEQNIADLYLLGKLPSEQRADFEAHMLDCAHCLDRLETLESMRSGLRAVAAEETAAAVVQAGGLASALALRRRRGRRLGLAALALALLAATTLLWRWLDRPSAPAALPPDQQVVRNVSSPAPTTSPAEPGAQPEREREPQTGPDPVKK